MSAYIQTFTVNIIIIGKSCQKVSISFNPNQPIAIFTHVAFTLTEYYNITATCIQNQNHVLKLFSLTDKI